VTHLPGSPRALLVHRGELADLRAPLTELGFDIFERAGTLHPQEAKQAWDLVVATPLLVPDLPSSQDRPVCIAVVERAGRTLESRLRRGGVDFVLRRPFHSVALRLLVLRALYRGPERRCGHRAPIGANVRIECRLRRFGALLVDLSEEGCRLRTERPLAPNTALTLLLHGELTGGRRLTLRGATLRPADQAGEWVVRFRRNGERARRRLAEVVERHARGPASLAKAPALEPTAAAGSTSASHHGAERRRSPRRPFRRRVIALGDEAARVLVGRDLSLGGMRVQPDANLRVGEMLRLAIHGGSDAAPLVVDAEVMRDEAERGYVLRFQQMEQPARAALEAMVCALPLVSDPTLEDTAGDLVLSQIVFANS
jgi:hypothetical protein